MPCTTEKYTERERHWSNFSVKVNTLIIDKEPPMFEWSSEV